MENKYTPDLIKAEKEPVVFFLPISDDEFTDYEIPPTNITIKRGSGVKNNIKEFIRAKYLGANIYTNDETISNTVTLEVQIYEDGKHIKLDKNSYAMEKIRDFIYNRLNGQDTVYWNPNGKNRFETK